MKKLLLAALLTFLAPSGAVRAQEGELRWGGDAEGGSPFVEADPRDPSVLRGFDVEVAESVAKALGKRPRFVQVAFASIDQSVERGDFDMGMSGVEETPARRAAHTVSIPYYEFREVLTVRARDRERYPSLASLRGARVGTLSGTIAAELLGARAARDGFLAVQYDDDIHPYTDLAEGRLDGVVLDHIIADRALRRMPGLATQPGTLATGRYVIVLAKRNGALKEKVDAALLAAMRDGTLEGIYRRWGLWDEGQQAFFARTLAGAASKVAAEAAPAPAAARDGILVLTWRYLPSLLVAALATVLLSCASMALAILVGVLVASGRVYGGPVARALLTGYVELTRGTPVLLQLFVLYYGLSAWVRLPAFLAALLGLGLNYAAYESEIYRGALEAVGKGQLEAARVLGLTEWQVFRFVRGPLALRLALAPMTNDFVALLKDSSLVSVITVVELTKQTSIFATNVGSWALPGALCAGLYLAMSLPLSRLARRLEEKWRSAG